MAAQCFTNVPVGEGLPAGVAQARVLGRVDVRAAGMNGFEVLFKPCFMRELAGTNVAAVRPLVAVAQHVVLHGRRLQFRL